MEWWKEYFDEDYFKIYGFREEQTQQEVRFIEDVLALAKGNEVLDLCCGHGWHAVELAERGYAVTGLDLSEYYLKIAEERAEQAGVRIRFIHSDMRETPFEEAFDAVINLFTSFGYFEKEEDNARALEAVSRSLKPNGKLLIDLVNREWVVKMRPWQRWCEAEGNLVLEKSFGFDVFTGRFNSKKILISDEGRKDLAFSVRAYSYVEFSKMMEDVGLKVIGAFGGYDRSDYGINSRRMILLAQKKGQNSVD